ASTSAWAPSAGSTSCASTGPTAWRRRSRRPAWTGPSPSTAGRGGRSGHERRVEPFGHPAPADRAGAPGRLRDSRGRRVVVAAGVAAGPARAGPRGRRPGGGGVGRVGPPGGAGRAALRRPLGPPRQGAAGARLRGGGQRLLRAGRAAGSRRAALALLPRP